MFQLNFLSEVRLGNELLRGLLPTGGDFVDRVFLKAYHLRSSWKHVSPLAAGTFGCYSVLITLPLIFKKKKNAIKAV